MNSGPGSPPAFDWTADHKDAELRRLFNSNNVTLYRAQHRTVVRVGAREDAELLLPPVSRRDVIGLLVHEELAIFKVDESAPILNNVPRLLEAIRRI